MGPRDRYGDMDDEDGDDFDGLEPEDGKRIDPLASFDRLEVRCFDKDFDEWLDSVRDMDFWEDEGFDVEDESSEEDFE